MVICICMYPQLNLPYHPLDCSEPAAARYLSDVLIRVAPGHQRSGDLLNFGDGGVRRQLDED